LCSTVSCYMKRVWCQVRTSASYDMPLRSALITLVSALVIATLSSCVEGPTTISPLYDRLSGRGPIVLGDDNPYLPANAFFQEQLKGSDVLGRFVQHNGEPTAMSLERKLYRKTRLGLYYADAGTLCLFARGMEDWQLEKTEQMSAQDRQSLSMQLAQSGRLAQALRYQDGTSGMAAPSGDAAFMGSGAELRGHLRPPQSAAEARLTRLPNGNYQHRVTFAGETLRVIAEWYTEEPGEASALAIASGRSVATPLQIGDTVTIPKRLMRNVHPLPEAAIP
jgi:hypothetical protein